MDKKGKTRGEEMISESGARRNKKNGPLENKGPLPKYTNYHSLTAPLDHVYAIIERNL